MPKCASGVVKILPDIPLPLVLPPWLFDLAHTRLSQTHKIDQKGTIDTQKRTETNITNLRS